MLTLLKVEDHEGGIRGMFAELRDNASNVDPILIIFQNISRETAIKYCRSTTDQYTVKMNSGE